MTIAPLFGYGGALAVGMLLAIVGGGGAILALPLFVYAFGLSPWEATTYSLFVVGVAAAVGTSREVRLGNVDYRAAVRFALPAFVAIHVMRRVFVPMLPNAWVLPGPITLYKSTAIMVTLAVAMIAAGAAVMRPSPHAAPEGSLPPPLLRTATRGFVVGLFTGLVGAGGGFLLVPALTLSERLPLKRAVATSLFVIALNSGFGFAGDLAGGASLDWPLLLRFAGCAGIGMIVGSRWTRNLTESQVRRTFGAALMLLAILVVFLEIR